MSESELESIRRKDAALGPDEAEWPCVTPVERRLASDRRALLRMVNELTLTAEQRKAWAFAWEAAATKATKERDDLRKQVDELTYQLAEERNATANDRDPSYHEERLKQENEALAEQHESVCVRMSSELGEMQLKLSRLVGDNWLLLADREAAEARVTELEKLIKNTHGDNCVCVHCYGPHK